MYELDPTISKHYHIVSLGSEFYATGSGYYGTRFGQAYLKCDWNFKNARPKKNFRFLDERVQTKVSQNIENPVMQEEMLTYKKETNLTSNIF